MPQKDPVDVTRDPDSKFSGASPDFQPTLMESPFFIVVLARQIRAWWREPKHSRPAAHERHAAPLPVTEMQPWYRDLPNQLKSLFEKPAPAGRPIHALDIEAREIWRDFPQQPASWMKSLLIHAVVILAMALPFFFPPLIPFTRVRPPHPPIFEPVMKFVVQDTGTGLHKGGGGDLSLTPASQGDVQKLSPNQLAPPVAKDLVANPILPVTASIVGPEMELPKTTLWGLPNGAEGPTSGGPGCCGGFGNGKGTGIGDDTGPGYGSDDGNGFPVSGVGGDVTAPQATYSPSPDYSEAARKAKLQGRVVLSLVVNAQGIPERIRVVQSLGLGLDENAVARVQTWKFTPGRRNGVPVPVRVLLEITFRLF